MTKIEQTYKDAQARAQQALKNAHILHDSAKVGTLDAKIRKFKRTFRANIKGGHKLIREFKDKAWGK